MGLGTDSDMRDFFRTSSICCCHLYLFIIMSALVIEHLLPQYEWCFLYLASSYYAKSLVTTYKNLTHHSSDNYCNLSYQSMAIFLTENWMQEHEPKFLQLQNFYQPKLLCSLEPINPLCIHCIFHQSLFHWSSKTMFPTGRYCHAWFPYLGCPSAQLIIYHA